MKLQQEIKQAKPFQSPQHEAALTLLRTTDVVRRCLIQPMERQGLSFEQFNVLRILRGAGSSGMATLEVASRLIEQAPAITRLLDKLEAKALVRRERYAHDRRQVLCWITDAGMNLLAEMGDEVEVANQEAFRTLTAAETKELIKLLNKVRGEPK